MPTNYFEIESSCLRERRGVTVYLPPNHDPTSSYRILYCADGQSVATFSQRIESDIIARTLPAVVLVGAHSSQHRAKEYTLGQDDSRFRQHEAFFTEELPNWMKAKFGLATDRIRTGVFGFSHGAAFAFTMASRHPELFGFVIAFSTAGEFEQYERTEQAIEQTTEPPPRFYLSAGTKEKPLLKKTRRLTKHLQQQNVACVLTERHAGHDYGYWEKELSIALKWGFLTDDCHSPV